MFEKRTQSYSVLSKRKNAFALMLKVILHSDSNLT